MEKTPPTYEQLQLLKCLCDTQSLNAAATQLSIPTSTASRWLSQLREMFDDKLFTRFSDGMVPTRRALDLASEARDIVHAYNRLMVPQSFDFAKVEQEVKIGCADNAVFSLFAHIADVLLTKSPGITLSFKPLQCDRFNMLRNGELDLVVSPMLEVPPDFHSLKMAENDYVLACGPQHPLVLQAQEFGPVSDEQVTKYPCIDVCFRLQQGGEVQSVRQTVFPSWKAARPAMRSAYFLPVIPLLLRSELTIVMTRRTAMNPHFAGALTIVPTVTQAIRSAPLIIWHKRGHSDPVMQWVRSLMLEASKAPND